MPDVTCSRCGQTRAGFERPPFPGTIGSRVVAEICQQCWGDWLKQQTMLINHYGLNVMDPQARAFLTRNLQAFLFKAGTSQYQDALRSWVYQSVSLKDNSWNRWILERRHHRSPPWNRISTGGGCPLTAGRPCSAPPSGRAPTRPRHRPGAPPSTHRH